MIYEFAITPGVFDADVLQDPDVARDLIRVLEGLTSNGLVSDIASEELQTELGRRIHRLPAGRVKEEVMTLVSLLDRRQRFVPREYVGQVWPNTDPEWYDEAVASSSIEPIHAIVTSPATIEARPRRGDHVGVGSVCSSDVWTSQRRTAPINRTTAAFIAALRPMLVSARSLKIVDPYIARIPDPRFVQSLSEVVRVATDRAVGTALRILEIYTSTGGSNPASWDTWKVNFEAEFRRAFGVFARGDLTFDVFVWEKRGNGPDLHNRFLLSNAVGVQLGYGLDESTSPGDEDDWCVMDESHRERVWLRYSRTATTFHPVHSFTLT